MNTKSTFHLLRSLLFAVAFLLVAGQVQAQRGVGFRFGSDFNSFFRADEQPLVDGRWSHLVFGPYYQAYFEDGGAQLGLNILYKGNTGKGFPNFPVIQQDFAKGDSTQNVGLTALELDFKVGPRFKWINPKIGMLLSYWLKRDGFNEVGETAELNRWNLQFPVGVSVEGPTGYGSVGFGLFYEIGLTNVLRNPDPQGLQDYDGSKLRGFNFELTLLFEAGEQKRKTTRALPPPPPLD